MKELAEVGYRKIEKFYRGQVAAGNDIRWEGWELVFFEPWPDAEKTRVNPGVARPVRHNGVWGLETRVAPDSDGKWRIPNRRIKSVRRSRN